MNATISGWLVKYDQPGYRELRFSPGCFHESDRTVVPLIDATRTNTGFFVTKEQIIGYAEIKEREEGVWCECCVSDTEQAKSYLRKMKFFPPKSFTFSANRIEERPTRNGNKIVRGVIKLVGLDVKEIPASVVEQIIFQKHKEEVTG